MINPEDHFAYLFLFRIFSFMKYLVKFFAHFQADHHLILNCSSLLNVKAQPTIGKIYCWTLVQMKKARELSKSTLTICSINDYEYQIYTKH